MNLYDRLSELDVIPDAYENWADYRNELTDFIINNSDAHSSIAILGAGHSNDYDLRKLNAHFDKIYLVDQNTNWICTGIKNQKLNTDDFEIVKSDFSGIGAVEYRQFADDLLYLISLDECEMDRKAYEYLTELYEANYQLQELALLASIINKIDYVAVVGVHSQLNNSFARILSVIENTYKYNFSRSYELIKKQNDIIINGFNDFLFSIAEKAVFIGAEKSKSNIDMQGNIDKVDGYIEGAYQCFEDVDARIRDRAIRVIEEIILEWPFIKYETQSVSYEMDIIGLEKNK